MNGKAPATRDDWRTLFEWLTPREHEVVALLARGETNKTIAAALGLSRRTIETHRANVLEKLRLRSNDELCELYARYRQALLQDATPA